MDRAGSGREAALPAAEPDREAPMIDDLNDLVERLHHEVDRRWRRPEGGGL